MKPGATLVAYTISGFWTARATLRKSVQLWAAPTDSVPSPNEDRLVAEGPEVEGLAVVNAYRAGDRRKLLARVDAPTLIEREFLRYLAESYPAFRYGRPPGPNRTAGHPPKPYSRKLVVASTLAWLEWAEGMPHKRAMAETAKRHKTSEASVKKYCTDARRHLGGKWWRDVCRLATKRKRWPELIAK